MFWRQTFSELVTQRAFREACMTTRLFSFQMRNKIFIEKYPAEGDVNFSLPGLSISDILSLNILCLGAFGKSVTMLILPSSNSVAQSSRQFGKEYVQ